MISKETLNKLQFDQIIHEVKARAIGEYTKERIETLPLQTSLNAVKSRQQETKEARLIIDSGQHVPFMGLTQIKRLMTEVQKGLILTPSELLEIADFLRSNRMIQKFFEKNQYQTPLLYQYSKNLAEFSAIEESIYKKIPNARLTDDASKALRRLRKQIREMEKVIDEKLSKFLKHPNNKIMIQEALIIKKGEHFTIPIKAAYKNKIKGTIVEQSSNGQTAFVEPAAVAKLNEEIVLLKAAEVAEEYQILAELTGLLSEQELMISNGIEGVTTFDLIFARGKYSRELDGITPKVNKTEKINLLQGRHPFLPKDAVPLDFQLGENYRGLVITGANAGGKTVVLKTVGLLTLMTQFGLQIPAEEDSEIAVLDHVFVDIGDQQNIENALSTFSGHMKNVAGILKETTRHTLVLLDEIGSGTEPNEGAGLAIAIMETLYQQGALVVATTHYGEIKRFAENHADFVPAAMAFDRETLTPKYRLQVGQVGDSQALWIAKKMAMAEQLIQQADSYIKEKNYPTLKKEFKQKASKSTAAKILELEERYQKGDRIFLTETKESALVFEDPGTEVIQVFAAEEFRTVSRKRVQLQASAQDLYPADYDLASLFSDFQNRKQIKDIERGSKKAHKQLAKDALARKSRNQTD